MSTHRFNGDVYPLPDVWEDITKDEFDKLVETAASSNTIRVVEPGQSYYWKDEERQIPIAVYVEPYFETPNGAFYRVVDQTE